MKNILPHKTLHTLYFSLIHPHITNGLPVWGNSTHVKKILTLQKKAIGIINNKPYCYHTEPLFKKENILTIDHQFNLQVTLFMHDFLNNRLPKSFNNFFQLNANLIRRQTRQHNTFYIGRPRTNFSMHLPNHSFPRIWNNMNQIIQGIPNRNLYKRQCRIHYLQTYAENSMCNNRRCDQCYNRM